MRLTSATALGLAILVGNAACSQRQGGNLAPRAAPDILTYEQINERRFNNAFEVVQVLRGNWLITKGGDSFSPPTTIKVYLDNQLLGGIEALHSIMISSVAYIRHYDGLTATTRWGLDHGQGVIFVSSRR